MAEVSDLSVSDRYMGGFTPRPPTFDLMAPSAFLDTNTLQPEDPMPQAVPTDRRGARDPLVSLRLARACVSLKKVLVLSEPTIDRLLRWLITPFADFSHRLAFGYARTEPLCPLDAVLRRTSDLSGNSRRWGLGPWRHICITSSWRRDSNGELIDVVCLRSSLNQCYFGRQK
jgi:hypothetical protein